MKIIFTSHAEEKIERREILKEEVINAIKNPDIILKKHGKYYY